MIQSPEWRVVCGSAEQVAQWIDKLKATSILTASSSKYTNGTLQQAKEFTDGIMVDYLSESVSLLVEVIHT